MQTAKSSGGAPFGDLHLAPGAVHIQEHEQVRGSVAFIFAVVALDLPRLGRDRPADLADELDRALVEADHRALGIGRFGIKIEHVLHTGDIVGVDLRNAPHVLAPWLEVIFGQAPTHRLARHTLVRSQPDQFTGQQLQRPASAARGWTRTGRCHQQGFLLARELAVCSGARLFAERRLQVAEDEAALSPIDGRVAHADIGRDRLVAGAAIRRQQYLRPLEPACRMLAAAQKLRQFGAFGLAEFDPIAYIHPCLLVLRHARTAESDGRSELPCKNLHTQAGPISGVYPPLHAPAPPAAGRN